METGTSEQLASPPVSLYLIRHGRAGTRLGGPDDIARPLDEDGLVQAKALTRFLAGRPIDRIVSSPAIRCQQSVRPLADERRLPIEVDGALWEGDPRPGLRLVERIIDESIVAALCSHGDVIPAVLYTLQERGAVLDRAGKCAKGSVWELDVAAGQVVAGRYHGPKSLTAH